MLHCNPVLSDGRRVAHVTPPRGANGGSIVEDWTVTINLAPLLMKAGLGRRGPMEVFGTDYPTPNGTAIRYYVHFLDLADGT